MWWLIYLCLLLLLLCPYNASSSTNSSGNRTDTRTAPILQYYIVQLPNTALPQFNIVFRIKPPNLPYREKASSSNSDSSSSSIRIDDEYELFSLPYIVFEQKDFSKHPLRAAMSAMKYLCNPCQYGNIPCPEYYSRQVEIVMCRTEEYLVFLYGLSLYAESIYGVDMQPLLTVMQTLLYHQIQQQLISLPYDKIQINQHDWSKKSLTIDHLLWKEDVKLLSIEQRDAGNIFIASKSATDKYRATTPPSDLDSQGSSKIFAISPKDITINKLAIFLCPSNDLLQPERVGDIVMNFFHSIVNEIEDFLIFGHVQLYYGKGIVNNEIDFFKQECEVIESQLQSILDQYHHTFIRTRSSIDGSQVLDIAEFTFHCYGKIIEVKTSNAEEETTSSSVFFDIRQELFVKAFQTFDPDIYYFFNFGNQKPQFRSNFTSYLEVDLNNPNVLEEMDKFAYLRPAWLSFSNHNLLNPYLNFGINFLQCPTHDVALPSLTSLLHPNQHGDGDHGDRTTSYEELRVFPTDVILARHHVRAMQSDFNYPEVPFVKLFDPTLPDYLNDLILYYVFEPFHNVQCLQDELFIPYFELAKTVPPSIAKSKHGAADFFSLPALQARIYTLRWQLVSGLLHHYYPVLDESIQKTSSEKDTKIRQLFKDYQLSLELCLHWLKDQSTITDTQWKYVCHTLEDFNYYRNKHALYHRYEAQNENRVFINPPKKFLIKEAKEVYEVAVITAMFGPPDSVSFSSPGASTSANDSKQEDGTLKTQYDRKTQYEKSLKTFAMQSLSTEFICFTNAAEYYDTKDTQWIVDSFPYHLESAMEDIAQNQTNLTNSFHQNMHPFNIAKYYKTSFHRIPSLLQFEIVIWIDGTIQITNPDMSAMVVKTFQQHPDQDIIVFEHQLHGNVEKEVNLSADLWKYKQTEWLGVKQPVQNITRQYQDYVQQGYQTQYWQSKQPTRSQYGMWCTCFVAFRMWKEVVLSNGSVRRERNAAVEKFLDMWYLQIKTYTTQDQVSFPFVLQKLGIDPYSLPDENIRGNMDFNAFYVKLDHGK